SPTHGASAASSPFLTDRWAPAEDAARSPRRRRVPEAAGAPEIQVPEILSIDDPDDPRLEPYRAVRERDLVGRGGLYVAEGRVVNEKVIAADPHALVSVLVAAPRAPGLSDVLAGLPAGTPAYVASQAVM